MNKHYFFDIEWIGFNNKSNKRVSGCYLIGDVYVGASMHIRNRVLQHLGEVYSTNKKRFIYDSIRKKTSKHDYIYNCIVNKIPIKVTYISDDVLKEREMYEKYNIPIYSNTPFYKKSLLSTNKNIVVDNSEIIINEKYSNFLSNDLISFELKGLYLYFLSKPKGYFLSAEEISKDTNDSMYKVKKLIRDLEKLNLLRRTSILSDKGKFLGIEYCVIDI